MDERMNRIGFIGLGRMGAPIARNILSAGFKLTVYDLLPENAVELIARGAAFAPSPRAVAAQSAIVALAVVDDAQVDDVLTGAEGVFAGADPGTIVVVHSTVLPASIKRWAEIAKAKDVHVIDAPVSGGEAGARQKSLCYMVGGDVALLERCRELFATSAQEIIHMGELGSGAAAKLIVQVATCLNMLAASEAELMAGAVRSRLCRHAAGAEKQFGTKFCRRQLARPLQADGGSAGYPAPAHRSVSEKLDAGPGVGSPAGVCSRRREVGRALDAENHGTGRIVGCGKKSEHASTGSA